MKNKLLYITRNVVPYIKELRTIAGSVTATILWQQLDYWFANKPDGFYKFLEPCHNSAYRDGDSWTEELAFSKAEFRTAFKSIGIAYKSKGQFNKAKNKFINAQNKEFFFCSYHDKIKGITMYFRNHERTDKKLDELLHNEFLTGNNPAETGGCTEVNNHDLGKSTTLIYGNKDVEATEVNNVNLHLYTENTTEITTTTKEINTKIDSEKHTQNSGSGNLIFPKCLEHPQRQKNAIIKLEGFDFELKQTLLDTIAFQEKHDGFTKSPLLFLSGVIKRYHQGTFDNSGAIETQRIRENHQRAILRDKQIEMKRNLAPIYKSSLEDKKTTKTAQETSLHNEGMKGLKAILGMKT